MTSTQALGTERAKFKSEPGTGVWRRTHTNSRPEPQGRVAASHQNDDSSLRGGSSAAPPQTPGGPQTPQGCKSQGLWLKSQAGRLFLSPHLGKAFPPSRGLRVRFPPRWKVPPRGPQRRAHHGNSMGCLPDTGVCGPGRAFLGPSLQSCQPEGEGPGGALAGLQIRPRALFIHTKSGYVWADLGMWIYI